MARTAEELRDLILANDELRLWAWDGRDGTIARDPRTAEEVTVEYRLTSLGVLDMFGAVRGATILQGMRAAANADRPLSPILREILPHLDGGGVNVGHADSAQVVGGLVQAGLITQAEANAVMAKAKRLAHPSVDQVSRALRPLRPDGRVRTHSTIEVTDEEKALLGA